MKNYFLFSFIFTINLINQFSCFEKPNNNSNIIDWTFGSFFHPENESLEFGLHFFSPIKPGKYPVIIFMGGFDGKFILKFYNCI
jgi:hypothetical protein